MSYSSGKYYLERLFHSEPPVVHTINFYDNNNIYATKTVEDGLGLGDNFPVNPSKDSYRFDGWWTGKNGLGVRFHSATIVTNELNVYAKWVYVGSGSYNPSGSSRSGGGGGNSGGSAAVFTPQNIPQTVTVSNAINAVNSALQAMKASGGTSAIVKLKNPGAIALESLQAIVKKAGTTPLTVYADSMTVDGKSVDVRISFNPANAAKSVDISASTISARAKNTKVAFEKWFTNTVTVISCTQQGDFGMSVEIATKIVPALNTNSLIFYTYDRTANTFNLITPTTKYWIDASGYIHFSTKNAGDIIITDKPLQKKSAA